MLTTLIQNEYFRTSLKRKTETNWTKIATIRNYVSINRWSNLTANLMG